MYSRISKLFRKGMHAYYILQVLYLLSISKHHKLGIVWLLGEPRHRSPMFIFALKSTFILNIKYPFDKLRGSLPSLSFSGFAGDWGGAGASAGRSAPPPLPNAKILKKGYRCPASRRLRSHLVRLYEDLNPLQRSRLVIRRAFNICEVLRLTKHRFTPPHLFITNKPSKTEALKNL